MTEKLLLSCIQTILNNERIKTHFNSINNYKLSVIIFILKRYAQIEKNRELNEIFKNNYAYGIFNKPIWMWAEKQKL